MRSLRRRLVSAWEEESNEMGELNLSFFVSFLPSSIRSPSFLFATLSQAHLINCTPAPSHSTLVVLIREYLDIVKAGGKEPRSLLEKKMFDTVKEEEDQAGQLRDAVPDDEEEEDVVLVVDESTLGKGKGKGKARASRSVSTIPKASSSSRVVASAPPPDDEPSNPRSPSPTPTDAHSTSPPDPSIPANNHFSNFAYAGARSLSSSTSNGGIKPRSNSAATTVKIVVPECTVRDIQMRKIKKCIFCEEDWSTGKKAVKVKWVRLSSSAW